MRDVGDALEPNDVDSREKDAMGQSRGCENGDVWRTTWWLKSRAA